MEQQEFLPIQKTLPNAPGIYKYYGALNNLLYIGKAKNIRKRVSSYFTKSNHSFKTHELVRQIRQIEFTIVHSEHDALLLENALIKEFKPRYNIELKDDKTYPYIVIKKEEFPRVFLTRRKFNDGSEYLGPFTSSSKVRDLLKFIKQHIPLRTCSLNLAEGNIKKGKYKVCLEYHLGNCKAPCVGLQDTIAYTNGIDQIRHILKGNLGGIIAQYRKEQQTRIAEMAYEKAEIIQQKINSLRNYRSSSVVVSPRLGDLDIFATAKLEDQLIVSFLAVRNGTIINSGAHTFKLKIEEEDASILSQAIIHFQSLFSSDAKELVIPYNIEFGFESFRLTVPKTGEKKKLLEIAQTNADYLMAELKRKKMLYLADNASVDDGLLQRVKESLSLSQLPTHIECFDNSNFQGAYPVSAMVCFKDGLPSKKDYRRFNVKTVEGINDFATMKEAVERRYKRLIEDQSPLPQLVVIDGGKGQLGSAMEAIDGLGLSGKMTVVGLAKNVEELFFPGDQESLKLEFNSDVLRFIRNIRDEVHRFGIGFHRQKRSKGTFKNELEEINGIGQKTANELLTQFRSVKNISAATIEELTALVGLKKATTIAAHFDKKKG